ncbi:MAG: transporter, YbiR family [Bacillota bacterium]|jgi:Na+/H+ antiporter NhaD/arsenite permease-like protein|nr:transporter, YbiR family [Bacillota bacterium]
MGKFKHFFKTEIVLVISLIAAIITSFYIKPSLNYVEYIDFKVLAILFCLMLIVSGFKKIGLFNVLAQKMTEGSKKSKALRLSLILICFFSSMYITNDVSLITFVPFAIMVLSITAQTEYIIYVIVMQTVAANLGSMLTPIGNPQNLYLYSFYNINTLEFFKITLPVTVAGLILIILFSLIGKNENINVKFQKKEIIKNKKQLKIYMILFFICILSVLHIVEYKIALLIILTTIILVDKSLLKSVDYGLLFTFICFFIFVGNMGKIESVNNLIVSLIKKREILVSILLSQIFSNVPAAVLLSTFTENYESLVIGSNIGGLGTIIASLASLISFKLYSAMDNSKPMRYLLIFTAVNILMLLLLIVFVKLF